MYIYKLIYLYSERERCDDVMCELMAALYHILYLMASNFSVK